MAEYEKTAKICSTRVRSTVNPNSFLGVADDPRGYVVRMVLSLAEVDVLLEIEALEPSSGHQRSLAIQHAGPLTLHPCLCSEQ